MVSDLFDPERWEPVSGFDFEDLTYHRATDIAAVRIAFDRPEVRNAFRPKTVDELYTALDHAKRQGDVGCVLLTGNGPSPEDGGWAFCSGGDQSVRGGAGYEYGPGEDDSADGAGTEDDTDEQTEASEQSPGRLHILEVQRLIRHLPKPVIAVVPGWAVGGGHSLHVVCDLTLASERAIFKQTDTDVASFDGGFGSAYLARQVGQKKAREIFFLGRDYSATEAAEMGMVNEVLDHENLEGTALEWAETITNKSPTSIRMLKYAFNLDSDGLVGQQVFAGEATRLAYMTDEAQEGRDAFMEKREPDFSEYPWHF
ncbi:1,4-dihydroxy-2-naphthoyl-CoA synthase [Halobacteriales archaeon QS_3_64_16]|nr:MAG: 1,4-dihydroxy-2-naphthoyl-CoA synthase [Halobacteriales archaeon QS_3_64_16]